MTFGLVRTPGHTVDHICVRTPDNVLYVGDAMMTGRVLHRAKFPYAFSMKVYLESLAKLRQESADRFIVAHRGVYREILPFIDLELRFLTQRMEDLLTLVGGEHHPQGIDRGHLPDLPGSDQNPRHLAYFEQASQTYLHYLTDRGDLELVMAEDQLRYRRVNRRRERLALPPTGRFR